MRRLVRAGLALLAFLTLATPVPPTPYPGPGAPAIARLFARTLALDETVPGRRELGPLRYLGGWVLSSDDRRFGSISSMHVEGQQVTALGDRAMVFRFEVPSGEAEPLAIIPLSRGPGAFTSNSERDSESLQVSGGAAWIGYENSNEIWRYRTADWRPTASVAPAAMDDWPANRGAETMARLTGGRFLVVSEENRADGTNQALLFSGDPVVRGTAVRALSFRPPTGHLPTDAAALPDGRFLLLARGFSLWGGWSAKLLLARLPEARGTQIEAWELATLAAPLTVDNMEALSVTQEGGRTIVWIASDDNLLPVQRTLLMKFEWVG